MAGRVAGLIEVKTSEGGKIRAKGNFTYNLGRPKRTAVVGADGVHGYKEEPQVAFVEGALTDGADVDLVALVTGTGLTVTLGLNVQPGVGPTKTIVLKDGWYAGEGTGDTEEGEVGVRWESDTGEEFT